MKVSFLLNLFLLSTFGLSLMGQGLIFTVNSTSELPGSLVTVDVTADNIVGIAGYQGTILYDESVLDYVSAASTIPGGLAPAAPNGTTIPFGSVTFSYFEPAAGTSGGITRDDGTIVFQINFQIKPTALIGTITTISLGSTPVALEYYDATLIPLTPIANSGTVGVGANFPVEMLDFQAKAKDGVAQLEWITASEEGNDYFEVQKSENGEDFFPIGTVKGAGNSQEHTYYNFDDPISATNLYYRLLQVDFDGTTSLSDVVELSVEAAANDWIQVFPNPSENVTQIRLENWEDLNQNFRIQLFSIDGRMMMEERIEGSKLVTDYSLGVAQYPRGSYLLKVTNALGKTSQNLLILN
ncbi:MAG: cohesin domain-containing protein [Bacteroidia bacterium]